MRRGEIWLAEVGQKAGPVLVLTRDEVLDVRLLVTVAEVTTTVRGHAAEVTVPSLVGLERPSVVNADGIHTVDQRSLTRHVADVDGTTMDAVCRAISHALGC